MIVKKQKCSIAIRTLERPLKKAFLIEQGIPSLGQIRHKDLFCVHGSYRIYRYTRHNARVRVRKKETVYVHIRDNGYVLGRDYIFSSLSFSSPTCYRYNLPLPGTSTDSGFNAPCVTMPSCARWQIRGVTVLSIYYLWSIYCSMILIAR